MLLHQLRDRAEGERGVGGPKGDGEGRSLSVSCAPFTARFGEGLTVNVSHANSTHVYLFRVSVMKGGWPPLLSRQREFCCAFVVFSTSLWFLSRLASIEFPLEGTRLMTFSTLQDSYLYAMAMSGKGVQVFAGYERGLAKQSYEPFTSKNRNTLMVVSSSESESRSPRNTFAHDQLCLPEGFFLKFDSQ